MTRKIRVAQIITGLVFGGGGQVMWTIARKIDRTRFDMDIYCVIGGGDLAADIERMGFKIKILEGAYDHRRLVPYSMSKTLELVGDLRRGRYDIVHTHLYQADVIGRVAAAMAGVPTVVKSLHNMGTWKTSRHRMVDRLLSGRTAKVICCSAYQREAAIRQENLSEDDVVTIYHGVDLERFNPLKDRTAVAKMVGLDPALRTVGTVGRMIDVKGQIHFLEAIPSVLAQHPNTQFVIVGDGPLRERLFDAVKDKPYRDRVSFLGLRGDIPELLGLMDVFVFPSLSEGLGIAVLEAMAARLPVVASEIRPLSELIIPGQSGFLVKPRDHVELAGAVNRLLADEPLRREMGDRGRERVRQHFTDTKMVKDTEDLYLALYHHSAPQVAIPHDSGAQREHAAL
jgi:glycosyltransferase involved in cell wall biosynthesis